MFNSLYTSDDYDLTSKYANNLNTQTKNSQISFPLDTFHNTKQYEPVSSNSQNFDHFRSLDYNEMKNSPTKKTNLISDEIKKSPDKKTNFGSEIHLNPSKDFNISANISPINYNYDKKITDSLTAKQWEQPIFLKVTS